jgi:hypothetical protein
MQLVHASPRALGAALFPLLVSTFSSTAHAGHYEDGMAALDRWDATRAFAFFELAAKNGDPRGLYEFAIHARRSTPEDKLPLFERAAALGDPRAMTRVAETQMSAIPGQPGRKPDFAAPASRVPQLLATACDRQQFEACGTLAQLHAGKMPEAAAHVGITGVDLTQARRWGDRWRSGRLAEARTGDTEAVYEIVLHGAEAWSGVDAATHAFHRVVYADINGDGSSGPGGQASPDPELRRRVDAWEIEQGLRPARLPDALTLARRIAAFEAADEKEDAEIIAASGRYLAADALARARYPSFAPRPWGADLGKATAVAAREASVFLRRVATTRRKLGLDVESWLPGRLVATFTPTQLYLMDRARSTPGAKKRAAVARLLRTATIDGDAVMARLRGDPEMESLGQDEHARRDRYAKDRAIELGPAAEPMLGNRERTLSLIMNRLHLVERNARLGSTAWARASAMITWAEARDIEMTLGCGHCRGVRKLLEDLQSERTRDTETMQAAAELQTRVTEAIHRSGIPLIDR